MGRSDLLEVQKVALVCRYMKGWDWEKYWSQPKFFIDVILSMLNEEAEESNRRAAKS